mgnify:CR=1 FL=1
MRFKDVTVSNLPAGSLLYPSSNARSSPAGGNYYCTERQEFMKDHQVFPAILIDPDRGTAITPTGIHHLGCTALVSVARR